MTVVGCVVSADRHQSVRKRSAPARIRATRKRLPRRLRSLIPHRKLQKKRKLILHRKLQRKSLIPHRNLLKLQLKRPKQILLVQRKRLRKLPLLLPQRKSLCRKSLKSRSRQAV